MTARPHYHVTGVAGVGMSALAQLLLDHGFDVSGSDRNCDAGLDLDTVTCLTSQGMRLVPQDGRGVHAGTCAVAVSTAIESDNPDLAAARRLGVAVVHRARLLADLARGKCCVAVTGTSGKSTVTGMIGWIFGQLGMDPVVVVGACLIDWKAAGHLGSVRMGKSDLWVVEADESDRSLLEFTPDWAVVTNVAKDHFEVQETRLLFDRFAGRAKAGVVDMTSAEDLWQDFDPEVFAASSSFKYRDVPFTIGLPGRHNAENALCAAAVCDRLGCPLEDVSRALRTFRGLHRRLEVLGKAGGVTVVDDYAHNPAKIRAAWQALAPYHRAVHCVWRPHGYGPLRKMMTDLAGVFGDVVRGGGDVCVLPVYDAGGTADRSVRSEDLVRQIPGGDGMAAAQPGFDDCVQWLKPRIRSDDAVLIMGARDPGLPAFGRRLLVEFEAS